MVLLKFKMAATDHLQFFVGAKTQKLKVRNYSNFTITFPTIWRCAGDFFKVLLKFKMTAMDELHIFIWSENEKLVEEWALMYRIDTGCNIKMLVSSIVRNWNT